LVHPQGKLTAHVCIHGRQDLETRAMGDTPVANEMKSIFKMSWMRIGSKPEVR
jgi:hypothetical protein